MSELVFNRVILERNNRVLSLLAVISLGLNVFLVFALARSFTRPPLIVYTEDGQISVLKAKALSMDEAFLKDFVRLMAGEYLSFTAGSLPKQIEAIRPYLAPKPARAILDSFKSSQAILEKQNMSQQFLINKITITKKTNPFWTEIEGTRNVHAGGNEKNVALTYVLEVQKIKPTESNPYGFLMTDIIEKPLNKEKDK